MGDLKVSGNVVHQGAPKTVDEQVLDITESRTMPPKKKLDELENTFKNLPDGEKKELYDRLKTKNRQDPVSRSFHYRFAHSGSPGKLSEVDRLLNALKPDHAKAPDNPVAKGGQPPKSPTKGPSPNPISDKTARAILIDFKPQAQEAKTDFGPEIQVMSKDILKTPAEKVQYARERLEKASKDDLRKIITESQNWPEDSRQIVSEAMAGSTKVMGRLAKEFTPVEGEKIVERSKYDSKNVEPDAIAKNAKALRAWMDNADPVALNLIVSKSTLIHSELLDQVKANDLGVFQKLPPRNKTDILAFGVMTGSDVMNGLHAMKPSERNSTIERFQQQNLTDKFVKASGANLDQRVLAGIDTDKITNLFTSGAKQGIDMSRGFRGMDASDKNAVFDALQANNDTQVFQSFARTTAPKLDGGFLTGLNSENVESLRKTLLFLGDAAKLKNQVDLAILYTGKANYLENWAQENFRRQK